MPILQEINKTEKSIKDSKKNLYKINKLIESKIFNIYKFIASKINADFSVYDMYYHENDANLFDEESPIEILKNSIYKRNFIHNCNFVDMHDGHSNDLDAELNIIYNGQVLDLVKYIPLAWIESKFFKEEFEQGRKQYLKIKNFQ